MFIDRSALLADNPIQLNYGVAVSDVDGDGAFELFVAGYGYRNLVLKWDGTAFRDIANETLADATRQAIGVAACDFDGDGREEIYVLNTDTFWGEKRFGDRLFAFGFDHWEDLFSLPGNQKAVNQTAGRSVAALDRNGSGRYGFFVANYGGPMRLYELNPDGLLMDVAEEAGVNLVTGGRGVLTGPLMSERMDIFAINEHGANFFFRNLGNGRFEEIAAELGLDDPDEHGRGLAVLDANDDGRLDIVYGNWEGPHRLFLRSPDNRFTESAPPHLASPSRIRTVIAADFDNDGYQEIFFNNIAQRNRLFGWREGRWKPLEIGEALEPFGFGTGGAVGDFDGDGRLELLLAHGEQALQPLTLYHSVENGNNWLRILPLTRQGAPARGALVTIMADARIQTRIIDAGSGYLCQMEPVAHFGLGKIGAVEWVEVRWPDGTKKRLEAPDIRQTLRVSHPKTR